MAVKECLDCGMQVDAFLKRCPKCDNKLDEQTDGSTRTFDIAHNGEKVHEALAKMRHHIDTTKAGTAQFLRLVVGTGVIREEVTYSLIEMERRKAIKKFDTDGANSGAVLIQLK